MKRYNSFTYLIPLLFIIPLITVQASESITYTHKNQENWQELTKNVKYKDLQKPLIQLYKDGIARPTGHITTTPLPLHLVVGTQGVGKSTFIFSCLGNKVTRIERTEEWNSDDDDEDDDSFDEIETGEFSSSQNTITSGQLTLTKTTDVPVPRITESLYSVTQGVKIYYTEQHKRENSMAFCDTEGILGRRKAKNNAEKLVRHFAPHFVLRTNNIGGIVFVLSVADITTNRGEVFLTCMSFLQNYFDLAMIDTHREDLKKSVMLLISKETDSERATSKSVAETIKLSYTDYYNKLLSNDPNNLGRLKPFFSLFLEKDVKQDEIDTITYKVLDKKNVRFFYPEKSERVQKIRQNLGKFAPIDSKCLSLHDDALSQHLMNKIMHGAFAINLKIHQALKWKNLAQLQSLSLQKDKDEKLKILSSNLQQRKEKLKPQNDNILYNEMLELVYQDTHKEAVDIKKTKLRSPIFVPFGMSVLALPAIFLPNPLTYSLLGLSSILGVANYSYKSSSLKKSKNFICTENNPIYRIEITKTNGGNIDWKSPKKDFIAQKFNKTVENDTIKLTSKDSNGVSQDKWEICHSIYKKDADCSIKFFSKKKQMQASEWQFEENKNKLQRIDHLLKGVEACKHMSKDNLEKDYIKNQEKANKHINDLNRLQEELKMINCWSNHVVKNNRANQKLIALYIDNYNDGVSDEFRIKKDDYRKVNHKIENEEEQKENGDNHNDLSSTNNSPSVTSLLDSLLQN